MLHPPRERLRNDGEVTLEKPADVDKPKQYVMLNLTNTTTRTSMRLSYSVLLRIARARHDRLRSFSAMSWMDSWSRPNKSSATPPPLYLTNPNTKYCVSCGRMISDRKLHKKTSSKSSHSGDEQIIKYCSDGCRKRRINPLDKKIDTAILALLEGDTGSGIERIDVKSRIKKGDHRSLIATDEIESVVFERSAPTTVDDSDQDEGADPYEVVDEASLNSEGNRPNPTDAGSSEKRQEGQKRANEREAVRRAARRAVVFGLAPNPTSSTTAPKAADKRKCEAVMSGQVVEPSYAKGNWYIRWRE